MNLLCLATLLLIIHTERGNFFVLKSKQLPLSSSPIEEDKELHPMIEDFPDIEYSQSVLEALHISYKSIKNVDPFSEDVKTTITKTSFTKDGNKLEATKDKISDARMDNTSQVNADTVNLEDDTIKVFAIPIYDTNKVYVQPKEYLHIKDINYKSSFNNSTLTNETIYMNSSLDESRYQIEKPLLLNETEYVESGTENSLIMSKKSSMEQNNYQIERPDLLNQLELLYRKRRSCVNSIHNTENYKNNQDSDAISKKTSDEDDGIIIEDHDEYVEVLVDAPIICKEDKSIIDTTHKNDDIKDL